MNVAEPSGAVGHESDSDSLPRTGAPPPRRLRGLIGRSRLSPSTRNSLLIIASVTACFVAADITITQHTAQSRIALVAEMIAAGLDNVAVDAAADGFSPISRVIDAGVRVSITDRDDVEIVSNMPAPALIASPFLPDIIATRIIAGPLGAVEVHQSRQDALAPALLRSILALGLGGFFAARKLRRAGLAQAHRQANSLATAMERATDGLMIWDRRHTLVAATGNIADAISLPASVLRRGAYFGDFLAALASAGDVAESTSGPGERRLSLALPNGDAWDLREHITRDGLRIVQFIDDSARARLGHEVTRLRSRVSQMANELQTQRVRGDAASRSKSLFLSHLSHSLRTPLNHIIGFADLLHHQSFGPIGDARYLSYAANIKQSGEALLDKLANMLELAEFDSGQRVLNREPIRLGDLFDWTDMRYREYARRAGIGLFLERADDVVVLGDRLGLQRLIGSVIDNSLKFTPSGGSITIAAWLSSDGVVLEFTDTGIGIASDTLTVLNTSFALSNDRRGNGIAIARAIAELSGGQLQINSSPGIGTTVAVVLPVRAEAQAVISDQQVA